MTPGVSPGVGPDCESSSDFCEILFVANSVVVVVSPSACWRSEAPGYFSDRVTRLAPERETWRPFREGCCDETRNV